MMIRILVGAVAVLVTVAVLSPAGTAQTGSEPSTPKQPCSDQPTLAGVLDLEDLVVDVWQIAAMHKSNAPKGGTTITLTVPHRGFQVRTAEKFEDVKRRWIEVRACATSHRAQPDRGTSATRRSTGTSGNATERTTGPPQPNSSLDAPPSSSSLHPGMQTGISKARDKAASETVKYVVKQGLGTLESSPPESCSDLLRTILAP